MSNILIAGGSGVIGSYLVKNLSNNKEFYLTTIGSDELNSESYTKIDLTDIAAVNRFSQNIEKPDILIFLVALAHEKGKNKQLDTFRLINYQTLVNLLTALRNVNKIPDKIIFSSTISVYGEKYNQEIYLEENEILPKSPYAITKLEAENYLLENFNDISWILRFAPVYTPEFLLNISRRTIFKNRFFRVGDGNNKLSLLSIKNIEKVIESIIDYKVPAGLYNVSDEKVYTFNDLLKFSSANSVMTIPKVFIKFIYYLNKFFKNTFINENSIKLLTDNLYPSDKLQKFVKLDNSLWDMKKP